MLDIYSKVEDLECTEYWGKADELREELMDSFNDFVSERGIAFTWMSDSHIAVDAEYDYEDIEYAISDMLEMVYDEFLERLEEEDEYGN